MKKYIFTLILALFMTLTTSSAALASDGNSAKAIILLIDYLTLEDIRYEMPYLKQVTESYGGIGLLNTNTGANRTIPHTYATVNAGSMAIGSANAGEIYNATEHLNSIAAGDLYKWRTGLAVSASSVVALSFPQLQALNEMNKQQRGVGLLGQVLEDGGLVTAVLGNADSPDYPDRSAALIAINKSGVIQLGDVSAQLLSKKPSVLERGTDYHKLLNSFKDIYHQADFIVLNAGDLVRLEKQRKNAFAYVIAREKREILKEIDAFIGELVQVLNLDTDLLIVASLTPSPEEIKAKTFFTPVVLISHNLSKGLLSSGSTKREGLITNIDLTATIIDYFHLPQPATVNGRPVYSIGANGHNTFAFLESLKNKTVFIYKARPVLVKTYVFLQICTILASLPILLFKPGYIRFMKYILTALMAYPLSLLLIAASGTLDISYYTFLSILITILIVTVGAWLAKKNYLYAYFFVAVVTSLTLSTDLLFHGPLIKSSTLGYDPMSGARYYGLGNEYMGVLIGASLLAAALAMEFGKKTYLCWLVGLYMSLAVFLMISSHYGANLGGTIAAITAFSLAFIYWKEQKIRLQNVLILGIGAATVLLVFIGLDLSSNIAAQSHLGRTVLLLKNDGLAELWPIMTRKLAMNIKLIKYTSWSRVFLATILVVALLLYRPVGFFQKVKHQYPKFFIGIIGIFVGSFVALIANDSGIVSAATMMIYAFAPLIYLAFLARIGHLN